MRSIYSLEEDFPIRENLINFLLLLLYDKDFKHLLRKRVMELKNLQVVPQLTVSFWSMELELPKSALAAYYHCPNYLHRIRKRDLMNAHSCQCLLNHLSYFSSNLSTYFAQPKSFYLPHLLRNFFFFRLASDPQMNHLDHLNLICSYLVLWLVNLQFYRHLYWTQLWKLKCRYQQHDPNNKNRPFFKK